MNVSHSPISLAPSPAPPPAPKGGARPPRSGGGHLADVLLGKVATLVLATIALLLGIATFAVLAGAVSRPFGPNRMFGLVLANLVALLLLGAALAGRLTRVWMERRRGSAGARLHVRLVMLFSGVAVIPAIVVAVFATAFFHYGIQAWFNDRVRTALHEALQTSQGYLAEHRDAIRADALAMANDLSRAGMLMSENPNAFADILATQTALRGLTEALIYEPITGQAMASAGLMSGLGIAKPPSAITDMARRGDVSLYDTDNGTEVHAVVQLDSLPTLMLMISRPVDPRILDHAARTQRAVAEYERLDQHRYGLQITFALIFALVALLVLSAAVLIGLVIANQIARPVGRLIQATERVRTGDLATRVPEAGRDDEIAGLSRAFNRMTGQLGAQRAELMDAYSQIDERRRFTEAVLAGVSAGVIGLDAAGGIELPNRAADELLGLDLLAAIGRPLSEEVPEFAPLLARARAIGGGGAATDEVQIGPANRRRTLLVRVGAELRGNRPDGYVVTFDDVTELEAAQRKAAWADVARRIAHEIKNPLTPIQLSAERLKRRFAREIQSDPETFAQCADTIVRQVGEIGRMVDEFSAFARMPQPVIRPEDVGRIAREALVLQRNARPEIVWATDIPESGPVAPCDRRLFGQALTNLLQNAADAVAMRQVQAQGDDDGEGEGKGEGESGGAGRIEVSVSSTEEFVTVQVTDDGVGLPQEEDRARLVEPYVTHKPKGTGLGLAIVKKIMEDHGGRVALDDRTDGPGAVATLVLPVRSTAGGEVRSTAAGEVRSTAADEGGR